jgi:hypothetical protein
MEGDAKHMPLSQVKGNLPRFLGDEWVSLFLPLRYWKN